MHNQINRLKEGNERACDNCGKIYEAIYFPYKSVNHCINCYENEHGVVLHKHRKKIGRKNISRKYQTHTIRQAKLFQRESTLEEITDYLKKQKANLLPVQFWYHNDKTPRKFSNYYLNDKYVNVRLNKGYHIKFLIDKIRKI